MSRIRGRGWAGAFAAAISIAAAGVGSSSRAAAGPADRQVQRVELGRRLFFDPAISRTGDNACVNRGRVEDRTAVAMPWDLPATRVCFVEEAAATIDGKDVVRFVAWVHATAPKSAKVEIPEPEGKGTFEVSSREGADTRIDLGAPSRRADPPITGR